MKQVHSPDSISLIHLLAAEPSYDDMFSLSICPTLRLRPSHLRTTTRSQSYATISLRKNFHHDIMSLSTALF